MNSFDYNQAQTLLVTHNLKFENKYDYIFKIKILEFILEFLLSKTSIMSKKKQVYISNRWCSSTYCYLLFF
jgi:hypothetical protein